LQDADLKDADLSETSVHKADLSGANLQNADLSDAYLGAADFTGANLQKVDFLGAHFGVFAGVVASEDQQETVLSGGQSSGGKPSGPELLEPHAEARRG